MPSTGWTVTHDFDTKTISKHFARKAPGAYALGYTNSRGRFVVQRVGRSDTNLPARLKRQAGDYQSFRAGYRPSAKSRFRKGM